MRRSLIPALLVLLVSGLGVALAQQPSAGGAFLPLENTVVAGRWTWIRQLTPWVVEGAVEDANETFVTFTEPTADRTITIPDASGTVTLGAATTSAIVAGVVDTGAGANPVSVTTGLSALKGCGANISGSGPTNNTTPMIITLQLTASAGRLDIYRWTTAGATSTTPAVVSYFCAGTA